MAAVRLLLAFTLATQLRFLCESADIKYPAVFNFGDSNSDTGGLVAGVAFPIVESMHLPFLNPYLDTTGAPSFQTGCNFATGGATILPANAASVSPFSFGVQVSQFLRFKSRVLELLKDRKAKKFLPPKEYFVQGLYAIDIGQNDLDGAFYSKTEDQVVAFLPTILSELEAGLRKLYDHGARRFWIHNTSPLGCLPRIIDKFGNDPSKLDELGCVESHNQVATLLNIQLHALCKKLQEELSDFNYTYVDVFSIKTNLISNYYQFGFKQAVAACCGYGGLPLNYDSRIACVLKVILIQQCGQTKMLNGSSVTATACNNSAEYVNWDGNHYTEAANYHVLSQILTGNYFDQPARNHNLTSTYIMTV
ncbi:hypothetical protein ACHQM5_026958 [Ranunculus cassubicifolius]